MKKTLYIDSEFTPTRLKHLLYPVVHKRCQSLQNLHNNFPFSEYKTSHATDSNSVMSCQLSCVRNNIGSSYYRKFCGFANESVRHWTLKAFTWQNSSKFQKKLYCMCYVSWFTSLRQYIPKMHSLKIKTELDKGSGASKNVMERP